MNVGLDLDGTITAEPDVLRAIASALIKDGHGVYIITAVFHPNNNVLQQAKIDGLDFVKGRDYTDVVFINDVPEPNGFARAGIAKRDACRELNISLFIDDKPQWQFPISEACRFLLFTQR